MNVGARFEQLANDLWACITCRCRRQSGPADLIGGFQICACVQQQRKCLRVVIGFRSQNQSCLAKLVGSSKAASMTRQILQRQLHLLGGSIRKTLPILCEGRRGNSANAEQGREEEGFQFGRVRWQVRWDSRKRTAYSQTTPSSIALICNFLGIRAAQPSSTPCSLGGERIIG